MTAVIAVEPITAPPRIVFGRAALQRLVDATAHETKIPASELTGFAYDRETARARFAIMLVAHEAGISVSRIGLFFGLDHSSVSYGWRKARLLEQDFRDFAALTERLRETVQ